MLIKPLSVSFSSVSAVFSGIKLPFACKPLPATFSADIAPNRKIHLPSSGYFFHGVSLKMKN